MRFWETYRRRMPATQLFTLAVCAALRFYFGAPWPRVGLLFIVMEVSGVIGTWWSLRLMKKIQAARDRLPLQ